MGRRFDMKQMFAYQHLIIFSLLNFVLETFLFGGGELVLPYGAK